MPQYYLPLLDFLKYQVAAFLREFVSTGRIPLDEVIEPKITVRCTLTGGMCTPNCPFFSLDTECKHKTVTIFAYTMGIIYVLLKLQETNTVYERDFQSVITTGKRYSDYLDNWMPYDPVGETISVESFKRLTVNTTVHYNESNYAEIKRYLTHLNSERKKRLESVNQMIKDFEEREGKIPEILRIQKRELEHDLTSPAEVPFSEWVKLLVRFVDDQSISEELVKEIVTFVIRDFIPVNDDDFPISDVNVDVNRLHEVIHQTKDLDDSSPKKWTPQRLEEFKNETNPYKKLLLLNDSLCVWKEFIVPKGLKITDQLVRAKVLIDSVFSSFIVDGTTYYILFDQKYLDEGKLKRINTLAVLICKVLDEQLGVDYNVMFNRDQLENQAIIVDNKSDYFLRAGYNAVQISKKEGRAQHEVYLELINRYISRVKVISCEANSYENINSLKKKGGSENGLSSRPEDRANPNKEGGRSTDQSVIKLQL